MNKIKLCLFVAVLSCSTLPSLAASNNDEKLTKENINLKSDREIKARMEVLENRLHEIKEMDLSILDKGEKRALKDEIKEIKKEMALDGRITISIGAAILIVLLLILLL